MIHGGKILANVTALAFFFSFFRCETGWAQQIVFYYCAITKNLAGDFGWMTGLILEKWKSTHGESQTIPTASQGTFTNAPNNAQAPYYFRGKQLVRLSLSTVVVWILKIKLLGLFRCGWVLMKQTFTTHYAEQIPLLSEEPNRLWVTEKVIQFYKKKKKTPHTHTLGDKYFNSEMNYLFYQCPTKYMQYTNTF